MPSNLLAIRTLVRDRTRDTDKSAPIVSTPEMNRCITSHLRMIAGRVPMGRKWLPDTVAITAGNDLSTLPLTHTVNSVQRTSYYQQVMWLRTVTDGIWMYRRSVEEMEAIRQYRTTANPMSGKPRQFCMWEDDAQVVNVRFDLTPIQSDTAQCFAVLTPDDLSADADVVPFSPELQEALADNVALELLARVPDVEWAKRGMDAEKAMKLIGSRIGAAEAAEEIRHHNLESTGRSQRWRF